MEDECKHYSKDLSDKLRYIYILAIIGWIILIYILGLLNADILAWFFLLIPIIVYTINFSSITECNTKTEKELFKADFLSIAFLTAIILINGNRNGDKRHVFKLLFIAIILLILSLIDFWLPSELLILNKHIKSIFQTAALSLLVYTLYIYYQTIICSPPTSKNKED